MIDIKPDFAGLDRAIQRLEGFQRSKRPVMRRVAGVMADAVEENFAQQGRPKWLGLAPATRKRRGDGKILEDSGRLASSIVSQVDSDSAAVGTNVRYAAIHQFGGEITRAAHSGWVRLRTDARGNLLRQGEKGRASRLAVFAKDSHKRVRTVRFTTDGSKVKIPARPFLALTQADADNIEQTVSDYLAELFR
ncbi:phage virion morphogenesis protein [Cupriavidus taiwanensis]|uniref:phage virion morphogenesis protein n=1 Tax=Cupriavidus taiwanensis TaxID=164546 RepID=UPI0004151EB5|nr:phage virion morphogenesis protein [Cupriavidus taiwanensis]SOZ12075.1 Phage virion morphogenesis protein [Cupriavidus taiwanensis]